MVASIFGRYRGGGAPPPTYIAGAKFNDVRNSQYVALLFENF